MTPEEQLLWAIFSNQYESGNEMQTETYSRKSFDVEAVRVTEENINEVAEWCGGEVRHTRPKPSATEQTPRPYVKVRVFRPMGERQTRAYVGDWVLYAGTGYKVYPDKAFQTCFTSASGLEDTVSYDDQTLDKVREVLYNEFLDANQANNAITKLQNQGILFRERATKEN